MIAELQQIINTLKAKAHQLENELAAAQRPATPRKPGLPSSSTPEGLTAPAELDQIQEAAAVMLEQIRPLKATVEALDWNAGKLSDYWKLTTEGGTDEEHQDFRSIPEGWE